MSPSRVVKTYLDFCDVLFFVVSRPPRPQTRIWGPNSVVTSSGGEIWRKIESSQYNFCFAVPRNRAKNSSIVSIFAVEVKAKAAIRKTPSSSKLAMNASTAYDILAVLEDVRNRAHGLLSALTCFLTKLRHARVIPMALARRISQNFIAFQSPRGAWAEFLSARVAFACFAGQLARSLLQASPQWSLGNLHLRLVSGHQLLLHKLLHACDNLSISGHEQCLDLASRGLLAFIQVHTLKYNCHALRRCKLRGITTIVAGNICYLAGNLSGAKQKTSSMYSYLPPSKSAVGLCFLALRFSDLIFALLHSSSQFLRKRFV